MITKISITVHKLKNKFGESFIHKFINSYNDLGHNYLDFINIDKNNKTHEEIAKSLGVGRVTITQWINNKCIPWSIKGLLEVGKKGFCKIPESILARIIGWGLGDGGLDSRPHYFFMCSNKRDLKKIKLFLEEHVKLKCTVKKNKNSGAFRAHNGEMIKFTGSGNTWILRITDTSFTRVLFSLGLPKGQKTTQNFSIPKWILNGNKIVKKEFLSALLECELERFRIKERKTKILINSPIFGMNKIGAHIENLEIFLNQIRSMLKEFGINSSNLTKPIKSNLRKDGNLTYFVRFTISSSAENILKLNNVINFKFNTDKQGTFRIVLKEAKRKIKRRLGQIERYDESLQMFKQGHNFPKIAKVLGISYSTAKNWATTGHLPVGISNRKVLERLIEKS